MGFNFRFNQIIILYTNYYSAGALLMYNVILNLVFSDGELNGPWLLNTIQFEGSNLLLRWVVSSYLVGFVSSMMVGLSCVCTLE